MQKVVPLGAVSQKMETTVGPRIKRRRTLSSIQKALLRTAAAVQRPPSFVQQWKTNNPNDGAPHDNTCCSQLKNFLGCSKTVAPWWAISILPDTQADTCNMVSRKDQCAGNAFASHGGERRKLAKQKKARLLEGTGRRVEVFVAKQREWYVGKIVANRHSENKSIGQLVDVKFSNGAILCNVRPAEVRAVPRATAFSWFYTMQFICIVCSVFVVHVIAGVYKVKTLNTEAGRGAWLFPNIEPVRLGNGMNTSLYNLTWDQVAAADAYPETWFHTMVTLVNRGNASEDFRHQPIGGSLDGSQVSLFREVYKRLSTDLTQVIELSLVLITVAHMELRYMPVHIQFIVLLLYPLRNASRWIESVSTTKISVLAFYMSIYFAMEILANAIGLILSVNITYNAMFLYARSQQRTQKAMQLGKALLMFGIGWQVIAHSRIMYSGVLIKRAVHHINNDGDSLERLAGAITYMVSSSLNSGWTIPYTETVIVTFMYISLSSTRKWCNIAIISLYVLLLVPLYVWVFLVSEPQEFLDPINFRLLFSLRSDNQVHNIMRRNRNIGGFGIWGFSTIGTAQYITFALLIAYPIVNVALGPIKTAWNVTTLAKRARKALRREVAKASGDSTTKVAKYIALKSRTSSVSTVCPSAHIFERQLASSKLRLDSSLPLCCLAPLFSPRYQLIRVFAATGVVLASYLAQVIRGMQGLAHHGALYAMLETTLDNMGCGSIDRDHVLHLAAMPADNEVSTENSSLVQLRAVIKRLGTKHRDSIYLLRMKSVGRQSGFNEFVTFFDRVEANAADFLGSQRLRQRVVPRTHESSFWAESAVNLLHSATGVRDRYNAFMMVVAEKSGAVFHPAPLKGVFRMTEKIWLRSVHKSEVFQPGDCANVFDVVRGMLVCPNVGVLNVCATLLVSCDHTLDQLLHEYVDEVDIPAATAAGIHTKIRVFRAKNRFRHPTASGWADALVNFGFDSDPDRHVCEVQLVHEDMLTARKYCNAHAAYSKFRSAYEILETFGLMDPDPFDDLQRDFVTEMGASYNKFLATYEHTTGLSPLLLKAEESKAENSSTDTPARESWTTDLANHDKNDIESQVQNLKMQLQEKERRHNGQINALKDQYEKEMNQLKLENEEIMRQNKEIMRQNEEIIRKLHH